MKNLNIWEIIKLAMRERKRYTDVEDTKKNISQSKDLSRENVTVAEFGWLAMNPT